MCVLKFYSKTVSFKSITDFSEAPIYSIKEKGDWRNSRKKEKLECYSLSLDASDAEWDEFPKMVQDVIEFLQKYNEDIRRIMALSNDVEGVLDFPVYSRLGGEREVVNQNDNYPSELIMLAASNRLSIEHSIYDRSFFEE